MIIRILACLGSICFLLACDFTLPQIANDTPRSVFSFGFKGRVEKLEDAFYSAGFNYSEFNYAVEWQKDPEYGFRITRSDTIIDYVVTLQDCQSIYYLVNWNDNWDCDSSFIHIDRYSSNKDPIPAHVARSIFKEQIITPLNSKFNTLTNDYHWSIEKTIDTTYVRILNQANQLRKLYVYSLDKTGGGIAEKEIINFLGDSIVHYRKSEAQRYVYLESKQVTRQ
jgi:hypothetical protein